MSENKDKSAGALIHKELAKLHSVKEMYENIKTIAEKAGCSDRLIYLEIQKIEATREAVVKALFNLFVVRSDTYALQREDKSYVRIDNPLTPELLKDHLEGKTTIGTYNLDRENRVKWLCFDVDVEAVEKPKETALLIYQACREAFSSKAVFVEASRYDEPSYHVWVVFQPEIPAYVAKFLGERILEKCNNPKIELFPKQAQLDKEGFGNLMKIPLGLHQQSKKWSCFLNPTTFEPLPIENVFDIEGCSLLDREIAEIKRITEREKPSYWFERKAEAKEPYIGEDPPCVRRILEGVEEGMRNESAIRLACFWLNFCKKEPHEVLTLLREWNSKNKPPLQDRELEIVLRSALRGSYNYGCDDLILNEFCNKEVCTILREEDVFKTEKKTIISLKGELAKKIHPAIDVIDDTAYVGILEPAIEFIEKKNKKVRREVDKLFFVTSLREKFPVDLLNEKKLRLTYDYVIAKNRWSSKSIEAFLKKEATVNAKEVYLKVKEQVQTYFELEHPTTYDYMTLWIIGTYFYHIFSSFPYNYFGGMKETGKTNMLVLCRLLAFNAIHSESMTGASVFRLIQGRRATVLIDETENLANPRSERLQNLRQIVIDGNVKGIPIYRTEKSRHEKWVTSEFDRYSPKIFANIQGIDNVLADRCISFTMLRAEKGKVKDIKNDTELSIWQDIRDDLYILFLTSWKELKETYETLELSEDSPIFGRLVELWKPILSLAKFFEKHVGNNLFDVLHEYAKEKMKEKQIEEMAEQSEHLLIKTLVSLVVEDQYYEVKTIKEEMLTLFEEEQKWLTTRWIGNVLRRLGFKEKRRTKRGYEYLLSVSKVQELAKRLGIPQQDEKAMLGTIENTILSNLKITSDEGIEIDELIDDVCARAGAERTEVYEVIERLIEVGTLFRPKPTRIKKV